MILPSLRTDLDFTISSIPEQPGLLIRDSFRYSDHVLVIPPPLVRFLAFFNGTHTDSDLREELAASLNVEQTKAVAENLVQALGDAGFLTDETYAKLKEARHKAFEESPVREAAFAGSAYPEDAGALRKLIEGYLHSQKPAQTGVIGIAAPHVSPDGGWQCYSAAYSALTPDLGDRTFVVLGTSHYGQPDKFGLTRKPFKTPLGTTTTNDTLVTELAIQGATVMEDYCHAVEHSIEFQVIFLQALYGPDVCVLPILCGSFGKHIGAGASPEDDQGVKGFLEALAKIAEREKQHLIWILGVDMAHMGARYGDDFNSHADQAEMTDVRARDHLRIERVLASDAGGFWHLVQETRDDDDLKWCGSSAFYSFLKAVPQARGTLRHYEQWNIDEQSVVTFAGISFTDKTL